METGKPFNEVVSEVLEYEVNGYGCLMIMRIGQLRQYHDYDTKETIFHLIQLGYDYKVDMDKVLNLVGIEGCTLFSLACREEELKKYLLRKRVRVNTLDSLFQVPPLDGMSVLISNTILRSNTILESIVMGTNPHIIDATGESPFNRLYER